METQHTLQGKAVMELICFGQLAEILGAGRLRLDHKPDTDTLRQHLLEQFPALASLRFTIAVNRRVVHDNIPLSPTDDMALMPPFSGG